MAGAIGSFRRAATLAGIATAGLAAGWAQVRPEIPRTWADEAVATFELPLAHAEFSPVHVSEEEYYALPERTIWKAYPIYHPDSEPPGYRVRLELLEPAIVFDEAAITSEQEWIEAGALVFRAPIAFEGPTVRSSDVLDADWYAARAQRLDRDTRRLVRPFPCA